VSPDRDTRLHEVVAEDSGSQGLVSYVRGCALQPTHAPARSRRARKCGRFRWSYKREQQVSVLWKPHL